MLHRYYYGVIITIYSHYSREETGTESSLRPNTPDSDDSSTTKGTDLPLHILFIHQKKKGGDKYFVVIVVCKVAFFSITIFSGETAVMPCIQLGDEVKTIYSPQILYLVANEWRRLDHIKTIILVLNINKQKLREWGTYSYSSNYNAKQIFSTIEEAALLKYIQRLAKLNYDLSKSKQRKFVFKYAVANQKKLPLKWTKEETAGIEWMRSFARRYKSELSLRKPQSTSLARATSFNPTNVAAFFCKLEGSSHQIWTNSCA